MHPTPIGYIPYTDTNRQDILLEPQTKIRHTVLFGKSGVGKTTLLRNMILSDIWNDAGVTVIDPHGQLIDELLEQIPKSRTNHVIFLQPANPHRAVSINIFEKVDPIYQPLVVSSIVSTFKTIWANAWGQQTEYLLTNFCFALLAYHKPTTILDILKLIIHKEFRDEVFSNLSDGVLQSFYHTYSNVWDKEQRAKASAPLLNKVSAFATNPLLRAVIGQHKN
jgi:ABC-type cobalamin/Fe3+-siderophores transport system ATPase subunit